LFGPDTRISPICETSNNPAFVRTASCSSLMLENCTGNSQPPKSIVLPPYCAYESNNGVRFNSPIFLPPFLTRSIKKGQRFPCEGKSLSWNLKVYRNGFPLW